MLLLEGPTMGTTYRIRLPLASADRVGLQQAVTALLNRLDREVFSTWEPGSELSRFNQAAAPARIAVSADMLAVTRMALTVHRLSQGAFDPSVGSLVDLWGFGPRPAEGRPPATAAIVQGQGLQGLAHLDVDEGAGTLHKHSPLALDYCAIAKGYAVDQVAALLDTWGLSAYLVEIGGELLVQGEKTAGEEWRIGLETPQVQAGAVVQSIGNAGQRLAIAASGDYLNYFEHAGKRYSHAIDPVSGCPIQNDVVSVTVLHHSAALADALATALLVMGSAAALAFSIRERVPVYLVVRTHEGYKARCSETFAVHLRGLSASAVS